MSSGASKLGIGYFRSIYIRLQFTAIFLQYIWYLCIKNYITVVSPFKDSPYSPYTPYSRFPVGLRQRGCFSYINAKTGQKGCDYKRVTTVHGTYRSIYIMYYNIAYNIMHIGEKGLFCESTTFNVPQFTQKRRQ